jgi:hypothetical protein
MSIVFIASSGTMSGSTNTVTFSNIPTGFTHLQLRISSRSTRSSTDDLIYARFNSDSTNSYSWHYLQGDGASVSVSGFSPDNVIYVGYNPAASSTANCFGTTVLDILDYANTSKNKTTRSLSGYDLNGSGKSMFISSAWYSTSAITSIFMANYATGANWAAGSRFDLYGITTSSVTGA